MSKRFRRRAISVHPPGPGSPRAKPRRILGRETEVDTSATQLHRTTLSQTRRGLQRLWRQRVRRRVAGVVEFLSHPWSELILRLLPFWVPEGWRAGASLLLVLKEISLLALERQVVRAAMALDQVEERLRLWQPVGHQRQDRGKGRRLLAPILERLVDNDVSEHQALRQGVVRRAVERDGLNALALDRDLPVDHVRVRLTRRRVEQAALHVQLVSLLLGEGRDREAQLHHGAHIAILVLLVFDEDALQLAGCPFRQHRRLRLLFSRGGRE